MANESTGVLRGKKGQAYTRVTERIDTNKTLTSADVGIVQLVVKDGITITLPAAAAGLDFIIENGGVPPTSGPVGAVSDGGALVTIAPNGTDTFLGGAVCPTAQNKNLLNTKATALVGDSVHLHAGTTAQYFVTEQTGIWAHS